MVEVLTWIGVGLGILVSAFVLTSLSWRPERNVRRSMLGHWFRSLIRLYQSDSLVHVRHRDSPMHFSLVRRLGAGSECWVIFSFVRRWGSVTSLEHVRQAVAEEPKALLLSGGAGVEDEVIQVQVAISNIWAQDAADVPIRLAEKLFDALGIDPDARFDLEFVGEPCAERAVEARRRRQLGQLAEW